MEASCLLRFRHFEDDMAAEIARIRAIYLHEKKVDGLAPGFKVNVRNPARNRLTPRWEPLNSLLGIRLTGGIIGEKEQNAMKTAADLASKELANTKGTGQIDRMQRNAYLNSKGIKPTGQFQLDLIFPDTIGDREDLRHIPNDYARSSIFTACNKREPRRTLMHEKLFHYSEHVSILYTGIELRAEDDEIVWLQILNYGQRVAFGEPSRLPIKDPRERCWMAQEWPLLRQGARVYFRLKANEVSWPSTPRLTARAGNLSDSELHRDQRRERQADALPRVIDPNLIVLFAGNTFTSHSWTCTANFAGSPPPRGLHREP